MKKYQIALICILSLFFIFACFNKKEPNTNTKNKDKNTNNLEVSHYKSPKADITVEEALALTKENALLIDVREPSELEEIAYSVKNIKNIPLSELPNRWSEIPKNIPVILACRSGGRSSQAFTFLNEKGFENISNMLGGLNAWSEKKLPVIKK